ncbi:DUF2065 domain-containing protein [Pseudoroseomonas globiformis]|uniref:DUF2065 domain-containing protein n=1 Tax=Teichococcus globiformis TaxID=2307229 RepID=A0ABV7G4E7_9PROT
MTGWQLLAGIAVVAALEGLLYAAFPEAMRRTLTGIASAPPQRLRIAGLGVAVLGVAVATFLVRG